MANNIQLIGCSNVKVPSDCENIVAINCSDKEFTSEDNNTVNIKNNTLVVNDDGTLSGLIEPNVEFETASFNTAVEKEIFFCDATSGNIVATLDGGTYRAMVFIKTDATANTITLTPATGLINGAGSYAITTQYQKVTVHWDGTNFYR